LNGINNLKIVFTSITTARLRLRRPLVSDAEAIFTQYASNELVTKYVGWPRHQALANTHAFLSFSDHEWNKWSAGPLLIEDRQSGVLIGSTGLAMESSEVASTGYVLARQHWGKGYATEALLSMVRWANELGVQRLYALCHADHATSRRVLEKARFSHELGNAKGLAFPNLGTDVPQSVCTYVFAR
jgi:[ribosomal protein S5]-alanine N-acetyltransferase